MAVDESAPSESETRIAFERFIADPVGIPTDSGFDNITQQAMMVVMAVPDDLEAVAEARAELERQFSGEHARAEKKKWDKAIRAAVG